MRRIATLPVVPAIAIPLLSCVSYHAHPHLPLLPQVRALLVEAAARGYSLMVLDTLERLEGANRLYCRLGFEVFLLLRSCLCVHMVNCPATACHLS